MFTLLGLTAVVWILSIVTTLVLLWQSHPKTAISFAVLFASTAVLVIGILAGISFQP